MSADILDLFQSTDEKLARVEEQLNLLASEVETLTETVAAGQQGAQPSPQPQQGRITDQPARQLEMSRDVPAGTQATSPDVVTATSPYDGRVLFVDIHWSDGAAGLVGVQFGRASGETFVPFNEDRGFLASNDFGNRYPLNAEIDDNDDLEARFINLDTQNSHLVNVYPTVAQTED